MILALWRHGRAQRYENGQRLLDEVGQQQAAQSAAWLKQHYPQLTTWVSEAARAQETARHYRSQALICPFLNPDHAPEPIHQAIVNSQEEALLLVGHQMWIGELAAHYSGNKQFYFYGLAQVVVFRGQNEDWRLIDGFEPR